jgi:hypothetical protein
VQLVPQPRHSAAVLTLSDIPWLRILFANHLFYVARVPVKIGPPNRINYIRLYRRILLHEILRS